MPLLSPLVLGWLALGRLAAAPSPLAARPPRTAGNVRVVLDSAYREVVVTVGPLSVPQAMAMGDDMMMMMHGQDSVVGVFDWPVTAWFRGVRLELVNSRGEALPRQIMHHMNLMNFDRRWLVYPLAERTLGFGQETSDMSVPATIGMPLVRGQRMGVVVMWHNDTGRDIDDAYLRLTFRLNPRGQRPRPITVMPFFVDAHFVYGGVNQFDVPPGGRTQSYEFTLPVSGRLLAVGGHLHDHGESIRLEDAQSGREIATVRALVDGQGHVIGVSRALLGLWRDGPHLRAGHTYRLLVRYGNPTADTLTGMMGLMAGIFAPDDLSRWPDLDRTDPAYLADLGSIPGAIPAQAAVSETGPASRPDRF